MAMRNPRLSSHVPSTIKIFIPPPDIEPLSERLWNATAEIRDRTLDTYFVQGIGDGSLDPTVFGGYMVQDAVYCYKAKQSIDIAAFRAPEGDLKNYLIKESSSYEKYYQNLFKKWDIDDPSGIKLGEACASYAAYERNVAENEDTIYFILSMIPCMKLWPWLGQQLKSENHGVYTEWFNNNFDPTYDGYKVLDAFVDEAQEKGTIDPGKASVVYSTCMNGEFAFFNSAQDKK